MSRRRDPYYRLRVECTPADASASHIDTLKVNPESFEHDRPDGRSSWQSWYGVKSIRDRNRYVHEAGGEAYHDPSGAGRGKWRGVCDVCEPKIDVGLGWPKIDVLMKGMYEAGESTVELRNLAAIVSGK